MRLLDLCTGIGGFSYAAHKLGWQTVAFCERDEFCQQVLAKNFPGVPIYDDVYTFPSKPFRGRIDVLTGGFPCQPFSQAGKRLGVHDERHLFPEMLRIIREVQPTWFVLENVNGLTTMALEIRDVKVECTKYSRSEDLDDYEAIYTREETMLLNRIYDDLEREGYAVQPVIIPAVALEADHERKRIWFVGRRIIADTDGIRERARYRDVQTSNGEVSERHDDAESCNSKFELQDSDAPNAGCEYGSRRPGAGEPETQSGEGLAARFEQATANASARNTSNAVRVRSQGMRNERNRAESPRLRHRKNARRPNDWPEAAARFCRVANGTSDELDIVGARDNRANRLKALGNAIYWPCAYEIFAAIEQEVEEIYDFNRRTKHCVGGREISFRQRLREVKL